MDPHHLILASAHPDLTYFLIEKNVYLPSCYQPLHFFPGFLLTVTEWNGKCFRFVFP